MFQLPSFVAAFVVRLGSDGNRYPCLMAEISLDEVQQWCEHATKALLGGGWT